MFFDTAGAYSVTIVIRAIRISRLMRLIKSNRSIKIFFNTLLNVMTIMLNILAFFALTLLMYSVLGCNLYATVMLQKHYNDVNNFRSFSNAMILLTGCLTRQNWHLIMSELTLQGEYNGV